MPSSSPLTVRANSNKRAPRALSPITITKSQLQKMIVKDSQITKFEQDSLVRQAILKERERLHAEAIAANSATATGSPLINKGKTRLELDKDVSPEHRRQKNREERWDSSPLMHSPKKETRQGEDIGKQLPIEGLIGSSNVEDSEGRRRLTTSEAISPIKKQMPQVLNPLPQRSLSYSLNQNRNQRYDRLAPAPVVYYSAIPSNSRYPKNDVAGSLSRRSLSGAKSSSRSVSTTQASQGPVSQAQHTRHKSLSQPAAAYGPPITQELLARSKETAKREEELLLKAKMEPKFAEQTTVAPKNQNQPSVPKGSDLDQSSSSPARGSEDPLSHLDHSYHTAMIKRASMGNYQQQRTVDVHSNHLHHAHPAQMKGTTRVGGLRNLLTARYEAKQRHPIAQEVCTGPSTIPSAVAGSAPQPRMLPPIMTSNATMTSFPQTPEHISIPSPKKVKLSTALFPERPSPISIPNSAHLILTQTVESHNEDESVNEKSVSENVGTLQKLSPTSMSATTTIVSRTVTVTKRIVTTQAVINLHSASAESDLEDFFYALAMNTKTQSTTKPASTAIAVHFRFTDDETAIDTLTWLWLARIPIAIVGQHPEANMRRISLPSILLDFSDAALITSRTTTHLQKLMTQTAMPLPKDKDRFLTQKQQQGSDQCWLVPISYCALSVDLENTSVLPITAAKTAAAFAQFSKSQVASHEEIYAMVEKRVSANTNTGLGKEREALARYFINSVISGITDTDANSLAKSFTSVSIESALTNSHRAN